VITSTESFAAAVLVVFIASPRLRSDMRRPDPQLADGCSWNWAV